MFLFSTLQLFPVRRVVLSEIPVEARLPLTSPYNPAYQEQAQGRKGESHKLRVIAKYDYEAFNEEYRPSFRLLTIWQPRADKNIYKWNWE